MDNNLLPGIDRRDFPRIDVAPPRKISGDISGELINITEKGIGFSTHELFDANECKTLDIDFPSKKVTVPIEIRWISKDSDLGTVCGASLVDPDKEIDHLMRKFMITKQFKYVVSGVKDKNTRREVLSFAKDFRDYIFELIELDNKIENEGVQDKDKTFEFLSELNNSIVAKGESLKGKINDPDLIGNIKQVFRDLVSSWIFKSSGSYRCLEKPKGYPGDYETLEIIYDRKTFTKDDELGYYFDLYFLNNPYAEAVRKRKDKLKDILEDLISKTDKPLKILDLACGGSKEVRDICEQKKADVIDKDIHFYLLDWDKEALEFSERQLEKSPDSFKIDFIRDNIIKFVRKTKFYEENGQMDIIYSIGLADYFTDRILKAMVTNAFKGLKSGGKFIIAHKDKEISFSHIPPEWFGDWTFFQRNEQDLFSLIESAGQDWSEIKIDRDQTGDIFFYTLVKR